MWWKAEVARSSVARTSSKTSLICGEGEKSDHRIQLQRPTEALECERRGEKEWSESVVKTDEIPIAIHTDGCVESRLFKLFLAFWSKRLKLIHEHGKRHLQGFIKPRDGNGSQKSKSPELENLKKIHRFMTIITINSYAQKIQCQKNLSFDALSVGVVEPKLRLLEAPRLFARHTKLLEDAWSGHESRHTHLNFVRLEFFNFTREKNLFSSHHSHTHGQSRVSRKDLHSYINEAKMKEQKHITKLSL